MSRQVTYNWEQGFGLTLGQLDTLGVSVEDPDADGLWVYGQFYKNGTYSTGKVVSHLSSDDLGGDNTVTEAIPIGSTDLIDTGEFANKDYAGARGVIYDGTGEGQTFYVSSMIKGNDDRVKVVVLAGTTGRNRNSQGWVTALDTTSKYRLWFPGRFEIGTGIGADVIAGAVQADSFTVTDDYKPYGYVKATGGAWTIFDVSGTLPTVNGFIRHLTGGLVDGVATNTSLVIGRNNFEVSAYASDRLIHVNLDIPIRSASFRKHSTQASANEYDLV